MVTKWQALKDFLRVQTLRRGSFTVLVVGPLGESRMQFGRSDLEMEVCNVLSVCPFAYGPDTFPGINALVDLNGDVVEMRVLNVQNADRSLERVHGELSYPIVGAHYDYPAPGAVYGGVCNDPGEDRTDRVTQVGVAPGYEIEVRAPVVFTVVLKVLGVEKARVTAKARPGA